MAQLRLELNWNKVLSNPQILSLFENLIAQGTESIRPSTNEKGEVVYGELAKLTSIESSQVLQLLVSSGMIEHKAETRVLSCPTHLGSVDLSPRVKCSRCGSALLKKGLLLQHSCGYIGEEQTYASTCPKCTRPASPQTLKQMGNWCECEQCKTRSAKLDIVFLCKQFNHEFTIDQAKLIDESSYRLTSEASSDLKGRLGFVIRLLHAIRARGATVEMGGKLRGSSGVEHSFDLLVRSQERTVIADVIIGAQGNEGVNAVLSMYAKVLDTGPNLAILIAVPTASEDMKKSASSYGMTIIEGQDHDSIIEKLLGTIEARRAEVAT